MSKFEKIGGGKIDYGVYRPKKTNWSEVLGGLAVAFVILVILANL